MRRHARRLLALTLAAAVAPITGAGAAPTAPRATLTVELAGIKNSKGRVRVTLFDSPRGFPGDARLARRTASTRPAGDQAQVVFRDLPYGTYAVAVLHDENENGKMDTNFLGIPKEGGGASNDPPARFGPPKFRDATFRLQAPSLTIRVRLRYP